MQGEFLSQELALSQIQYLSERTSGWSGADLAGLVRSSVAFALDRCLDVTPDIEVGQGLDIPASPSVSITVKDFYMGFEEIRSVKESNRSLFQKVSAKLRRSSRRYFPFIRILRRLSSLGNIYNEDGTDDDNKVNKTENEAILKYILSRKSV